MSNHSYDDALYQQGVRHPASMQERQQPQRSRSPQMHVRSRSDTNVPLASASMSSTGRSGPSGSHQPPSQIIVGDHDVLSGRGVNIAQHPGNERFRSLVTSYTDRAYCTSYSVTEKKAVAMEIIRHIRCLDPPGRFLKREGRGSVSRGLGGPWIELTERECIKKTCQALRDCNRQDRTGYAGGVAAPPDVKMVVEQASKAGLTAKDRAEAAAKTVGFSPKSSDRGNNNVVKSEPGSNSSSKRTRDEVDNDYYASLQQPPSSNADLLALQSKPHATSSMSLSSDSPHRHADQHYYNSNNMGNNAPQAAAGAYSEYYPTTQHIPSNYYQPHSSYGYNHPPSSYARPPPMDQGYGRPESMNYQMQGPDNTYQPPNNYHHHGLTEQSLRQSPGGLPYSYNNQPMLPDSLSPFHPLDEPWPLKKQRTDDTDPSTGTSASSPSNALDNSLDFSAPGSTPREHETDPALFSIKESHTDEDNQDPAWPQGPDQLNQDDSLGNFGAGLFD